MTIPQRICHICHEPKDLTEENFHRNKTLPGGFRYDCKPCRSAEPSRVKGRAYAKKHRKNNPEAVRNAKMYSDFRVRPAEVQAMLEAQNHRCKICGRVGYLYSKDRKRMLYIDHSHARGHVRALLCHYCNSGLGYFQDSPELLEKAKQFLLDDASK